MDENDFDYDKQEQRNRDYWRRQEPEWNEWDDRKYTDELIRWDKARLTETNTFEKEQQNLKSHPDLKADMIYELTKVPLRVVDNPDFCNMDLTVEETPNGVNYLIKYKNKKVAYRNKKYGGEWSFYSGAEEKTFYKNDFLGQVEIGRRNYEQSFRAITEKRSGVRLQPQTHKDISRGASEKRVVEISEKEAKLARENKALLDTQKRLNIELNTLKRSLDNVKKQAEYNKRLGDDNEDLTKRLSDRGDEIRKLKAERDELKEERDFLEEDLEVERERGKKLDSRISEEGKKIQDLKDKLRSQEQKLSTYDQDLKSLSKQKAELLAFQNEVRNSSTSNAELEGTLGKRKKDLDDREQKIAQEEKTLLEGKEKVIKWRNEEIGKVKNAQDTLDEYKKQLDEERLKVSAENTEKIRATEEVIRGLEEKLATEKQKFNEEMNAKNGELDKKQNIINNERVRLQQEQENFKSELNEAQDLRKLWDQEQFVKEKLNRELNALRDREAELNAELQSETKRSLDLKTKLDLEISRLEKQQSETNTDLDAQILEIKEQLRSEQNRRQSEFMRRIKAQDDLQSQTKELGEQKVKIQELYEKLKASERPETSEKGTGTDVKKTSEKGAGTITKNTSEKGTGTITKNTLEKGTGTITKNTSEKGTDTITKNTSEKGVGTITKNTSEKSSGTITKQTTETGTNPFVPDTSNASVQNDLGTVAETVNSLTEAVEHYNNLHDILNEKNLELQNTQLDIKSQMLKINQLSTELNIVRYENRQLKEENNDQVKIRENEIQRLKNDLGDKTKAYNSTLSRIQEQENNLLKLGEQLYQKELELDRKNDDPEPIDFSVEDLRDFGGINEKYEDTLENIETMLENNTPQKDIEEMITTQINGLKVQAESLGERLDKEQNPLKQQAYRIYIEKAELVADRLKMDFLDKKPDTPEMIAAVQEETDNNPEVAFEKFKKFVRENFIGISGALIGIAGIITSIAVGIRSSAKTAGNVMQKSGNENSTKGGLQGFVGQVIENLGKIISWSGDNIFLSMGIIIVMVVVVKKRR